MQKTAKISAPFSTRSFLDVWAKAAERIKRESFEKWRGAQVSAKRKGVRGRKAIMLIVDDPQQTRGGNEK